MVTNLYSIKIIKPVWLGDLTYSPIHTSIYIYILSQYCIISIISVLDPPENPLTHDSVGFSISILMRCHCQMLSSCIITFKNDHESHSFSFFLSFSWVLLRKKGRAKLGETRSDGEFDHITSSRLREIP